VVKSAHHGRVVAGLKPDPAFFLNNKGGIYAELTVVPASFRRLHAWLA
jgi:hypothetical protein